MNLNSLTNEQLRSVVENINTIIVKREKNFLNMFISRDFLNLNIYLEENNYDLYYDLNVNTISNTKSDVRKKF